jgi:DNA-binding HxlR family transcriptional regulator
MATQPHRSWSGRELAQQLQIKPRNLHTQLREWALAGFITRTGFATYALNTPPAQTSSTTAPDP